MYIYIVSSKKVLPFNSGFIKIITDTYEEAFKRAEVGQFIHMVDTASVHEIVNAGKIAVEVNVD